MSRKMAPDTPPPPPPPLPQSVPTDLILSPHAGGVRHEVTPILLQDAALLICQGAKLPRAALQVCVQAPQTLSAP